MLSLVSGALLGGLGLVVAGCIGYLSLLLCATLFARPRTIDKAVDTAHGAFVILIPAHDEELVIAGTLQSLKDQDYPAGLYEVVVIADNCSDSTAEIARRYGSVAMERTDPNLRGKGYALDWAIQQLLRRPKPCDAFVIVDADTWVAPNFLSVAANRMESDGAWGRPFALQGRYGVQNPDEGWRAALMSAAFDLFNHIRPRGREALHLSVGLKGNGMVFTRSLLESARWSGASVTEDIDFGLDLARNYRVRVAYEPGALVKAQMPTTSGQAVTQRQRWEAGRYQIVTGKALPLVFEGLRARNLLLLDSGIDLLILPLGELFALALVWTIGAAFYVRAFWHGGEAAVVTAAALVWGALLFYVLVGLWVSGARVSAYKALLFAPLYVVWKLVVYVSLLFGRLMRRGRTGQEWVRTARAPLGATTATPQPLDETLDKELEPK